MSPSRLLRRALARWRVGVDPRTCPRGTIVLFPRGSVVLRCGIAALVEVARGEAPEAPAHAAARGAADWVLGAGLEALGKDGRGGAPARDEYAGGREALDLLTTWARGLKRSAVFPRLFRDQPFRDEAGAIAGELRAFADREERLLADAGARLAEQDVEAFSARVLRVRDVAWHVEHEALAMLADVIDLNGSSEVTDDLLVALRGLVAVLRCIDRIEIRGRDSAGLALQVVFADDAARAAFQDAVGTAGLDGELERRTQLADLPATAIVPGGPGGGTAPTITFLYKEAAEVGRLGDNGAELKRQIRKDGLLRLALSRPDTSLVVLGHTRWASSGVISVPNCHPVDNATSVEDGGSPYRTGRIFVVMNGDVDNHLELRREYEEETGGRVSPRITTDTKVVALEIERQLARGGSVEAAFRRACARFEGSCAIGMLTDLAPGRVFLSLCGSGQSLYVGISPDGFFASSEVYGLVEETGSYVKMDGESERVAGDPRTAGQVVSVALDGPRGRDGLTRSGLDGAALPVEAEEVRVAEITTRDVDRGDFQHFFRKEITQATRSVARTLMGRVTEEDGDLHVAAHLLSPAVRERLAGEDVNRIFVVGQGTAAIAGAGVAEFVRRAVPMGGVRVEALPATEMSGFRLADDMNDTLVIAVTQSGSTADTNRAVDLARKRGALVIAIVNRRNSDITYRADSVVYTSDGRDVEMSVASTKAFYAQIVAGGLLAIAISQVLRGGADEQNARDLRELVRLPELMQRVLDGEDAIRQAAEKFAPTREHWAVVASGPNHVAAREVRIKLSELCYKSIAVDTVEDKKHIDLSSEPMTIVLAAGNPEAVLNDVVKDVAIFKAHKGVPVVFATEGERRFDPYASAVIHLPAAPPLSSMVLSALAGHLFGYHAARAIDDNARFLAGVRSTLVDALDRRSARDDLPALLSPSRREYLERLERERFTSALDPVTSVRLAMLFDRVTGNAIAWPEDRTMLGGEEDLVAGFVNTLGDALDQCARPIDAIKHQAKIVTVGTSRPEYDIAPVFAGMLDEAGIAAEDLAPVDLLELHRIARAVASVDGLTRYEVADLRPDHAPGADTRVRVAARHGVSATLTSRVNAWAPLIGTKRQVTHDRRLYVGVGRRDGRRIAILPLLASSSAVEGLALLHLSFADELSRDEKQALLGARERPLRDLVAEADREFDAAMLDALTPEQIVLEDVEDLAERVLNGGSGA